VNRGETEDHVCEEPLTKEEIADIKFDQMRDDEMTKEER